MKFRCFHWGRSVREGIANSEKECSLFGKLEIKNPATGEPYLTRYIIVRTPWLRVFLHRFHQPDPDLHVHNHPWLATSLILRGGYSEFVGNYFDGFRSRYLSPGHVNKLQENEYHQITYVRPNTWTLVWGGAYFREWGFLVDGEHVDWRTYLNVKPTLKKLLPEMGLELTADEVLSSDVFVPADAVGDDVTQVGFKHPPHDAA